MKTADIKALPFGTELFFCTSNGWNTGRGQSGSLITVHDATVGNWRFNENTEEWERSTHINKYGGYKVRTTHGILMKDAQGRIFVATPAHIRGLYSKCTAELATLRELNTRQANFRQEESARQEAMRKAITEEFGLRISAGYSGYGVATASAIINTEDLLNLLRELSHSAQQ